MGAEVRDSRHKLSHEVIADFLRLMMVAQVAPDYTREETW